MLIGSSSAIWDAIVSGVMRGFGEEPILQLEIKKPMTTPKPEPIVVPTNDVERLRVALLALEQISSLPEDRKVVRLRGRQAVAIAKAALLKIQGAGDQG